MKKILLAFGIYTLLTACGGKDTPKPEPPKPPNPPTEEVIPINSLIFKSGVWAMHSPTEVTAFEKARGAKLDIIAGFAARETWANMQSSWYMNAQSIPTDFKGTMNIAMPLWPENGSLEESARGDYNAEWEKMGRNIASRYPDAYLRPGWEMNIKEMYWHATPATADKWIEAYRNAVVNLRKGSDKFRICWVVNFGKGQTGTEDATMFYPGNEYVDFIGFDVYDWWMPYTTPERIKTHKEEPYGWDWWLAFAKKQNKKLVIPEWGVVSRDLTNVNYGGDNAKFINFVYSWMRDNKDWIEMECYFANKKDIKSDLFTTTNPLSSAEYKAWMPKLKK